MYVYIHTYWGQVGNQLWYADVLRKNSPTTWYMGLSGNGEHLTVCHFEKEISCWSNKKLDTLCSDKPILPPPIWICIFAYVRKIHWKITKDHPWPKSSCPPTELRITMGCQQHCSGVRRRTPSKHITIIIVIMVITEFPTPWLKLEGATIWGIWLFQNWSIRWAI